MDFDLSGILPEVIGNYIGAVGQKIAALLQTLGLYGQSDVLDTFASAFGSIGALIFMVSFIGATISVAVFGSYRKGIYLVLAPGLFWFMLSARVDGGPTVLRFGERVNQKFDEEQATFIELFADSPRFKTNPKLSWFFVQYDNLVSSVVQNTVALLVDTKNKDDLLIAARERAFSSVLSVRAGEANFNRLVSMGSIGTCAEVTKLSHQINQKKAQIKNLRSGGREIKIAKAQLVSLEYDYKVRLAEQVVNLPPDVLNYSKTTLKKEVKNPITCQEVWNLTIAGANVEAENWLETLTVKGRTDTEVPWDRVKEDVEKAISENNPGEANDVIAGYLLKNTYQDSVHGQLMSNTTTNSPFDSTKYGFIFNDITGAFARGGYLKLAYFAGTIPYIQGVLLFLLAMGYPFFVVFLLMPGRWQVIFVWMSLWVWVKSWDVGFAVIFFVRDLLFQFVSHDVNPDGTAINYSDPSDVFNVVFANDPLKSYNTFITLISLLTVSVPFLTAHLCLGATNLFEAFKMSIDQTANRFGQVQTSASRRDIANIKDAELKAYYADEQIHGALEAGRNWQNSQTADGKSRLWEGEGLLPRHIEEQAKRADFAAKFSRKAVRIRGELAALTGRRMTYASMGGQSAQNLIEADMNRISESNLSRVAGGPGMNVPFPGLFDTQGRNDSASNTSVPGIKSGGGKQSMVDADND